MRYITTFLFLTACGAIAADTSDTAVGEKISREKNSEILAEKVAESVYRTPLTSIGSPLSPPTRTGRTIPALILPNNVCVINTNLSPDRTIEEHIEACVAAHRLRQRLIP